MMTNNTIQAELNAYNEAKGIDIESVHNAESYSRHTIANGYDFDYAHQLFCLAIWSWSVELWEHMRAWQDTLVGLPTEAEIQAKIDEKPFVFVG